MREERKMKNIKVFIKPGAIPVGDVLRMCKDETASFRYSGTEAEFFDEEGVLLGYYAQRVGKKYYGELYGTPLFRRCLRNKDFIKLIYRGDIKELEL
jgi:hypothetical protein